MKCVSISTVVILLLVSIAALAQEPRPGTKNECPIPGAVVGLQGWGTHA